MIEIFYFLLGSVIFTFYTWGLYLSVMMLMKHKETLTIETKCFAYPLAFYGVLVDFLYNVTLGSIMFLEIPREWLLTKRLQRHLNESSWRGRLSRWFCRHLLDPFDPKGTHCGQTTLEDK